MKRNAGLLAIGTMTALSIAACQHTGDTSHSGSGGSGAGAGGHGGQGTASTGHTGGSTGSGGTSGTGGAAVYPPLPPPPAQPELWYWHGAYLSTSNGVEPAQSEALIDQAAAAGYGGLALWDASVTRLTTPSWDPSVLKEVVAYATQKGLKILPPAAPYGYSNDLLRFNPNWAEGQAVVGSQFTVTGGQLVLVNSLPPPGNTGFEQGNTVWFDFGDAGLSADMSAAHTGSSSAHFQPSSGNNQRLTLQLGLTPWRLYHLGLWVQTSGFTGSLQAEALDSTNSSIDRLNANDFGVPGTSSWTRYDVTFNSRESTQVLLYIGVWGGHGGDLWVDDIVLEETALVNVLRRSGTPVKVYDPTTQATYTEGTDVAMIVDPAVAAGAGSYDAYHTPPTITVPQGSALTEGQTVAIDAYSVFPVVNGGVGACLSDPDVQTWMNQNLAAVAGIFPKGSGVFLQHDEMRHMNSCALCQARNITAGQLLASNMEQTAGEVNAAMPGAQLYVWSDMFDPYHNAVDDYYLVEGTIAGSWAGLPPGMIIMNWHLGAQLPTSLTWFAGKDPSGMQPHGFQQIIAGYYEASDGGAEATQEMAAAMGVPGVIGAMYTTWEANYGQLQAYADGVRSAWAAYVKSVDP